MHMVACTGIWVYSEPVSSVGQGKTSFQYHHHVAGTGNGSGGLDRLQWDSLTCADRCVHHILNMEATDEPFWTRQAGEVLGTV